MAEVLTELYVLAYTDTDGNVTGFPKGGGSSTPARIKAYDTLGGARRGRSQSGGTIVKVTQAEAIE